MWWLLYFLLGAVVGAGALFGLVFRKLLSMSEDIDKRRRALQKENAEFLQNSGVLSQSVSIPRDISSSSSSLSADGSSGGSGSGSSGDGMPAPSVVLIDATRVELQFGGKTSSRSRVYACLKDTSLYFGPTQDTMTTHVSLSGCEVRHAQPQAGFANGLEILNPSQKLVNQFDYIYLGFPSKRLETVWYEALGRWCVLPVAEPPHTVPRESTNEGSLIRHKGWLNLQFGESTDAILTRYCILEDHVLTHFDSNDLLKSKHAARIHLSDVTILEVSPCKFKAVGSSMRPMHRTYEFVYFTVKKLEEYPPWKAAFDLHNARVYESLTDSAAMESHIVRDASLRIGGVREPAVALNAILHRISDSIRISPQFLDKVRQKMTKRLQEKLEDRNLQSSVENLNVVKLYIPKTIPHILWTQLISSPLDKGGRLNLDAMIEWNSPMDPITFQLTATIVINWPRQRFKTFDVDLSMSIYSLFGKLNIECDPFPANRFCASFYEEPQAKLVVNSGFSVLPDSIRQRVEEFLVKKIKTSLLQKFLKPNRKYYRLPYASAAEVPVPHVPMQNSDDFVRALGGLVVSSVAEQAAPADSFTDALMADEYGNETNSNNNNNNNNNNVVRQSVKGSNDGSNSLGIRQSIKDFISKNATESNSNNNGGNNSNNNNSNNNNNNNNNNDGLIRRIESTERLPPADDLSFGNGPILRTPQSAFSVPEKRPVSPAREVASAGDLPPVDFRNASPTKRVVSNIVLGGRRTPSKIKEEEQ